MKKLLDILYTHTKWICPVLVIIAAAITVVLALGAKEERPKQLESIIESIIPESTPEETSSVEYLLEYQASAVPLMQNDNEEISILISTFFNSWALGDRESMTQICDKIEERDMLRYMESAKYISHYPVLEIYTKPGYSEEDTIAYVYYKTVFDGKDAEYPGYQVFYISKRQDGSMYLKRTEFTDEMNAYIIKVSEEADVVEISNRVNVEYNELLAANPDLLTYLNDIDSEITKNVGVLLAQLHAQQTEPEETEPAEEQQTLPEETEVVVEEPEEIYAVANTTVNVRSSDSTQAERLGQATQGLSMLVLEQKLNGWTKVMYEGKEGFIKSEYLTIQKPVEESDVIGQVKATTTVNVRALPNQSSTKLGVLAEGTVVDLLGTEDGWSRILYNDKVGYVKSEYVQNN